MCRNDLNHM